MGVGGGVIPYWWCRAPLGGVGGWPHSCAGLNLESIKDSFQELEVQHRERSGCPLWVLGSMPLPWGIVLKKLVEIRNIVNLCTLFSYLTHFHTESMGMYCTWSVCVGGGGGGGRVGHSGGAGLNLRSIGDSFQYLRYGTGRE